MCGHWSSGSPAIGLLAEFQVYEGLGTGDARNTTHPAEDLQQVIVVLTDHLHEDVERSRGDHHVVDLAHAREVVGHPLEVTLTLDADHGLPAEAQRHGIG